MATITVNGNTIDPLAAAHTSVDAEGRNFIYVQAYHDLLVEEKSELTGMKVYIQEYVAEYTYLCRYEPANLERIRALKFVRQANVYEPALKSTISLKDMVEREADRTEYEVDLMLHDRPNVTSAALAPYVATAAGVSLDQLEILPTKIRLTVNQDRLDDLAALDSINRIEEVREKSFFNDRARGILQVDALAALTKYQGEGQIICVADSGFDQGVVADSEDIKIHPAFVGRIKSLVPVWPENDARDPVGHGTHVCGSICGSGSYVSTSQDQNMLLQGSAPGAKLVVQAMSRLNVRKQWVLKVPADITMLFSAAYDLGSRVHNNSWGDNWDPKGQLGYEGEATTIDKFVCGNPDFVILVAAGNDARQSTAGVSQIGALAAAKNCITVGATGTTRPNDGDRYDPEVPALSGMTQTALFSSRGPTLSTVDSQGRAVPGRIKPDLVAPGVAILSAASRTLSDQARVRVRNGVSDDRDWLFMSGTSMATPLVAGCVALLREALHECGKEYPSAALVKALLVNGAVNFSSPKGPGFDAEQGFGRVDINSSITMVRQSAFVEGGSKLEATKYDVPTLRVAPAANKTWSSGPITILKGSVLLAVTLAYPDAPGALLQNDVNLIVQAGGAERHGNMGSSDGYDATNNVEKIIWENVPGETFTIIVQANAFTLLDSEQAFAVAWDVRAA